MALFGAQRRRFAGDRSKNVMLEAENYRRPSLACLLLPETDVPAAGDKVGQKVIVDEVTVDDAVATHAETGWQAGVLAHQGNAGVEALGILLVLFCSRSI